MNPKCPNCGHAIELVGAGDLNEQFKIGPNALQHAREQGRFPDPWLSFGNRNIYLRSDVEAYREERARSKVEKTVADLMESITALPEDEAATALSMLEQKLGDSGDRKSRR